MSEATFSLSGAASAHLELIGGVPLHVHRYAPETAMMATWRQLILVSDLPTSALSGTTQSTRARSLDAAVVLVVLGHVGHMAMASWTPSWLYGCIRACKRRSEMRR